MHQKKKKKKSTKELPNNDETEKDAEMTTHKKKNPYLQKRDNKLLIN